MKDQASDTCAAADVFQGVEKISRHPMDAISEGFRSWNEIQPGDRTAWEGLADLVAQGSFAGTKFHDASDGIGVFCQCACDPTGISEKYVDELKVSPASDSTGIPMVERVENFRSDDTIRRTHGLQ